MISRISFEVKRRDAFPEPSLAAVIVMPAQAEGLRGEVRFKTTKRYTAFLEGNKEAVQDFAAYLEILESAIGEVTGTVVTHDHETPAFAPGVKMVFHE